MKKQFAILLGLVLTALSTAVVATPANAAVSCWTTFDPGSPQGDPMRQYYKNCGSSDAFVAPYLTRDGTTEFFGGSCKTVKPGNYVTWYFAETVYGASYSTATCANTYLYDWYTTYKTAGNSYPCNTTFRWFGTELEQRYGNCDTSVWSGDQMVTTAWRTSNGNLYASSLAMQVVKLGYTGHWLFSSTVQANYTTVLANISPLPS